MATLGIDDLKRLSEGLGFALVGVARAEPTRRAGYIRRWLGDGKHGEMGYLARNVELRLDPDKLLPGARSIICVADRYPSTPTGRADGMTTDRGGGAATGRIARYAWGGDYHRVMKKRLFTLADSLREQYPDHTYRVAVDTAPILEREYAERAGLGWVGKHTLLIHPRQGSWLLLGQIVTTLPIDSADSCGGAPAVAEPSHCGTCTRCIDACPTDCISPYELDAQRCISYLTLEHRGVIDPALHPGMGDWVAGCDVCQEVCPFNREERINAVLTAKTPEEGQSPPTHPRYATRPPAPGIGLLEVLAWDEEARRNALRGSALKRIKLDMFKRNALIAAGNCLAACHDESLYRRVRQLADDPDEPAMVRQTARDVLNRLVASQRRLPPPVPAG